jgi:DMSO/TMAO reductase YedYZ molybdopterin-dependent catalytic subunit
LRTLEGSVTPPNLFFIREHFSEPEISLETWKIRIEGRVAKPYELNFSDLVELPSKTVEAVLECAGNAANGSAVSNGIWEGVPLSTLLERAQPVSDAAFLLLEGADSGRLFEDRVAGPYTRMVPFTKCTEASSLVAFKLNDLLLPKRHGFPARALFPSWYGMDSVKWLRRIVVMDDRAQATLQQTGMDRLYNRAVRAGDKLQVAPVSSIQVKSSIAWPNNGLKLPAGRYSVWGFAWTGAGRIRDVALSTDAGKTWSAAGLQKQASPHSWVRWSYSWQARPGEYVLMSRAADQHGNRQPVERDPARKDAYELNWCVPIHISVH